MFENQCPKNIFILNFYKSALNGKQCCLPNIYVVLNMYKFQANPRVINNVPLETYWVRRIDIIIYIYMLKYLHLAVREYIIDLGCIINYYTYIDICTCDSLIYEICIY